MHLVNNEGWGVNAGENDNRWNDARFVACVFYYNRQGNVWFGGTGTSGAVEFIGCRSERAGNKHLDTANPVNADAPGWRFNRGVRINLVACSTDANTGNGVEIAALNSSQASDLYSIQIAGCAFGRDGTGNNIALPAAAGIKLKGFSSLGSDSVQYAKVVGCSVTTGKSSDNGTGTIIGPKYGIWCENAQFFDLLANRFEGSDAGYLLRRQYL